MKKLLLGAAVALSAMVGAASAATYSIDGLINVSQNGFGSSLIHKQKANGDMSGDTVAYFSETVEPGGYWQNNGDIQFFGIWNGDAYAMTGNIDQTTAGGWLKFDFAGQHPVNGMTFTFDGALSMGLPNSFDGSTVFLWGETGTCNGTDASCYGIDLRIGVSEVPLPATALLLIAGVGALGAARRKRVA